MRQKKNIYIYIYIIGSSDSHFVFFIGSVCDPDAFCACVKYPKKKKKIKKNHCNEMNCFHYIDNFWTTLICIDFSILIRGLCVNISMFPMYSSKCKILMQKLAQNSPRSRTRCKFLILSRSRNFTLNCYIIKPVDFCVIN